MFGALQSQPPLVEIEAQAAIFDTSIICQKAWALGLRSTFQISAITCWRASLAGPCLHDSRALPTVPPWPWEGGQWSLVSGCGVHRGHTSVARPCCCCYRCFLLLMLFLLRDQHSNRSGGRPASFPYAAMSFRPLLVSLSVWASPAKHSALKSNFLTLAVSASSAWHPNKL